MKRKAIIEFAAMKLADEYGILHLTRANVCDAAGVPIGSFTSATGQSFSDWVVKFAHDNKFDAGMGKRVAPELRRAQIISAGAIVARSHGLNNVTRKAIADEARVSTSLISHHFPSLDDMIAEVVARACDDLDGRIIGEAILSGALCDPSPEQIGAVLEVLGGGSHV